MGDMADYYIDQQMNAEFDLSEEICENYLEGLWQTKEGEKIKICDMETDHIRNTINFIDREGFLDDLGQDYIKLFKIELEKRK